jgi:hypothetical protein
MALSAVEGQLVFYVVINALLVFKMFFVAMATGFTRRKTGTYVNPEDPGHKEVAEHEGKERVKRWRRIHLNDLENIPAFFIAYTLFIFAADGSKDYSHFFSLHCDVVINLIALQMFHIGLESSWLLCSCFLVLPTLLPMLWPNNHLEASVLWEDY